ncbi:hypothetical protein [Kribbella sp. NPDC051620]|uniref:thiolase family protein n=1 Tax=Kribbella sp. NPDC051620 TaxID=3364120 RepID=UPI0037B7F390
MRRSPKEADFGIAAFGLQLGDRVPATESVEGDELSRYRLERSGFKRFCEISAEIGTETIGSTAATRCLERAGVDPGEVDYVIVVCTSVPEYLIWDLSAAVAAEAGCHRASTLLLSQGCGSALLGLEQAAGIFATRPEVDKILYVGVDRLSARHQRRSGTATTDSDGAVAMLLTRSSPRLTLVSTAQTTLGRHHELFRLPYCGRIASCLPDDAANSKVDVDEATMAYFGDDPEKLIEWAADCDRAVIDALEKCCAVAEIKAESLDHLLMLHDRRDSMLQLTTSLGVPADRTNIGMAAMLGHFGGSDPLICLAILDGTDKLSEGQQIGMLGLSSGMQCFAAVMAV